MRGRPEATDYPTEGATVANPAGRRTADVAISRLKSSVWRRPLILYNVRHIVGGDRHTLVRVRLCRPWLRLSVWSVSSVVAVVRVRPCRPWLRLSVCVCVVRGCACPCASVSSVVALVRVVCVVRGGACPCRPWCASVVVVQVELVRMWSQAERVDLVLTLVVDPGLDHIVGKDLSAREKRMVGVERRQRFLE
jgi:hypothetical protein